MRIRPITTICLALLAAAVAANPAFGAVLGTYEERPTWNGVTTGIITDDFESIGTAPGGWNTYNTDSGLTRGSINYTGVDGGAYTMLAVHPISGENNFGSGILLRGADYNNFVTQYLQLTLPEVYSAGFDLGSAFPNSVGIRIELSTGEFFIRETQDAPALSFWGVQTDTPISWIRLSLTPGYGNDPSLVTGTIVLLDNVSYGFVYTPPTGGGDPGDGEPGGNPEPVPEVTTLLYMASGLGLLMLKRKSGLSPG